jgi:hypothetical protein
MNCTSAEDGTLLKVAEVIDRTKALKGGDASKIVVSAIAAERAPYVIATYSSSTTSGVTEPGPSIRHSCSGSSGTFGDPAVRVQMWADALDGVFVNVCDDLFDPALTQIAGFVTRVMGPSCLEGNLVDSDEASPDLEPNCVFTGVAVDAQGRKTRTPIPSCDKSGGGKTCWAISSAESACSRSSGVLKTGFQIKYSGPVDFEQIETSCAVCNAGATGIGCDRY